MNEREQIAACELARVASAYAFLLDSADPEVVRRLPEVRRELAARCRAWMEESE